MGGRDSSEERRPSIYIYTDSFKSQLCFLHPFKRIKITTGIYCVLVYLSAHLNREAAVIAFPESVKKKPTLSGWMGIPL